LRFYQANHFKKFKPIYNPSLLKSLENAYEKGCRQILVHGLAGTLKTTATHYFAKKKLEQPPLYLRLPCLPREASDFFYRTKSPVSIPDNQFSIIIDELEKTTNREVIGWLLRTLDLEPHLVIGITNEPDYIKKSMQVIWRRFTSSGALVYAPLPNDKERIRIVHAVAREVGFTFSRNEEKKLAMALQGYTFPKIRRLFEAASEGPVVSIENILNLAKKGVGSPFSLEDEEEYKRNMYEIFPWDFDNLHSL